jgi:ABC-2 type transport system permease protein
MAKKITFSKPKFNLFNTDLKNLFVLVRKELSLFFNSTLAYVVIAVSIILHFFLFFMTGSFFAANQADLTQYFVFVPWMLLILVPVLTMGSISNEEREGTIEFILSKPVGTLELILSKIISVFLIIIIVFAVEFLLILPIMTWGNFDTGKILSQYIGAALLALSLSSFGVLISSIARSQISSFLISAVGIFLGLLLGVQFISIYLPAFISKYLERISILSHYTAMLKGAIDISDLLYFIGFAVFSIFATYYVLMARKLPRSSGKLTSLGIFTAAGLLIIIIVTAFGQRIPGRLDLTENKINTLTQISKDLVKDAEKDIKFTVYYTDSLPPQFQTVKRDFLNMIREYESAGSGKLKVEYISTASEDGTQKATEAGIQPLKFQEQGSDNIKLSVGYLGLQIEYGDKKELVPSAVDTSNLEYEISGILKNLTVENKKKIGILDTKVKHSSATTLTLLKQILEKEYEVVPVEFSGDKKTVPSDISTLIIAGANAEMSESMRKELRRFFNDGGAMFLLSDPALEETMSLTTNDVPGASLNNFFEDIGVSIDKNIIFDLQSFLSVNYNDSYIPIPYPFFPVALSNSNSPINSKIDGIGLRWASRISVDYDKAKDIELTELFNTSNYAGKRDIAGASIDPEQDWNAISESSLEKFLVAVSINEKDDKPGRAIVVSDSDFMSDEGIQSSQNAVFTLSSIEWLTQDESLATIKAKERLASPLTLPFIPNITSIVQFGGPVGLVLLVAGFGFVKNKMRRKMMERVYTI